jgi:tetratricopeptide (TPR) repeat protein
MKAEAAPAVPPTRFAEGHQPINKAVKRRLVAVAGGFVLLIAGLIYCLFLLSDVADESTGGPGGLFAGGPELGSKLFLEEQARRLGAQGDPVGPAKSADEIAPRQKPADAKPIGEQKRSDAAKQTAAREQCPKEADKQKAAEAEKLRLAAERKAAAEKQRQAAQRKAAEQERLKREAEAKRKVDFQKLVQQGREALAAKRYGEAAKSLDQACKLVPNDGEVRRDLARAREAHNKERAKELAASGKKNLTARNYEKAVNELTLARDLNPEDPSTIAPLERAQRQLAKAQKAQARKQARTEADSLIKKARTAFKEKRYQMAYILLAEAYKRAPHAFGLRPLSLKTREALIKEGRKALTAKRLKEAVTFLSMAHDILPLDKLTLNRLHEAEKKLKEETAAAEKERKKQLDLQRAASIRKLLGGARQAVTENRLDDAAKMLAEARQLSPNDPDIIRMQNEVAKAQKAKADAAAQRAAAKAQTAAAEARKKRQEEFEQAMKEGRTALTKKDYDTAIKHFEGALQLAKRAPEDAGLVKQADKALRAARDDKAKAATGKNKLEK